MKKTKLFHSLEIIDTNKTYILIIKPEAKKTLPHYKPLPPFDLSLDGLVNSFLSLDI